MSDTKITIQQAIRFIVVGFSNTAISYLVFEVCLYGFSDFGYRSAVAQAIGYAAGITWSFLINRRWTFKSQSKIAGEALRFLTLQFMLLILTSISVAILADIWTFSPRLSWLFVMAVSTIINFFAMKMWVYR